MHGIVRAERAFVKADLAQSGAKGGRRKAYSGAKGGAKGGGLSLRSDALGDESNEVKTQGKTGLEAEEAGPGRAAEPALDRGRQRLREGGGGGAAEGERERDRERKRGRKVGREVGR